MKLDELVASAKDALTVSRVFGDPIERDGVTTIPVATVAGGAGGGGGHDAEGQEGEGGGFGVSAKPAGVYVISDGDVRWRPAIDVNRLAAYAVALAAIVAASRWSAGRRSRRRRAR
jgi:uncharacterized spore protein YtfJ